MSEGYRCVIRSVIAATGEEGQLLLRAVVQVRRVGWGRELVRVTRCVLHYRCLCRQGRENITITRQISFPHEKKKHFHPDTLKRA